MAGLLEEANRFSDSARDRDRLSLGSSTSALLAALIQRLASQHPTMTVATTAHWSADRVAVMLGEGPTTSFQPVGEILNAYGLTLKTS